MQLAGSHECGSARAERDADCRIRRAIITADDRGRSSRLGRHAEARRGSPVVRLYIGMRRIGTSAEASGPQLRNAREASARDEALAASDEARVPGARDPLEASVRRGWRESSKRSSASVGADAPFRGKGIASPDQPREPKQSWRPQGPTGLDVRDHDRGTEFAESRFRASRVTFVRRQRPYRRSPRSRSSGCCSARAKRSSHRCRDKRCSVSGHENPSGRNRRSGRVLVHRSISGLHL